MNGATEQRHFGDLSLNLFICDSRLLGGVTPEVGNADAF